MFFSFLFVGLLGWQEMLERKTMNKWVLFLSLFVWLIVLWYPYNRPDVTINQSIQLQASVFLVGHTFLLWFWAEGMLKKLIYPLMILWVSAEAIIISSPTLNDRQPIKKADIPGKKYHFDDTMEAVKRVKASDTDPFYRMDKVYGSIKTGYNDGMVQGFFGSKMYQSHNHKYYVEFLDKTGVIDATKEANTRWLVGLSATNILHGLFSIKYLMSNEASAAKVDGAIYTPIDTVGSEIGRASCRERV